MNWISALCVIFGLVLTACGLYRRDEGLQHHAQRARAWLARRLRRSSAPVVGPIRQSIPPLTQSATATVTPREPDPDSPLAERVTYLETYAVRLLGALDQEREARRREDRDVMRRVRALNDALAGDMGELRRLIDEAKAPERMEWAGLAVTFIGAITAPLIG